MTMFDGKNEEAKLSSGEREKSNENDLLGGISVLTTRAVYSDWEAKRLFMEDRLMMTDLQQAVRAGTVFEGWDVAPSVDTVKHTTSYAVEGCSACISKLVWFL